MEQNTPNIGSSRVKQWFLLKKESLGIIGMIAVIFVWVKLFLFYQFMSVQSNFILIWVITAGLIYLFFSSFKNKWIPACVYLIFSILMFADVAYASFFNRYLSINMLGAAGFLGDVGASIKAVLKPKFFLLFVDNILIFVTLFRNHFVLKNKENTEISFDSAMQEGIEGDYDRHEEHQEGNKKEFETEEQMDSSYEHSESFTEKNKTEMGQRK